MSSQGAAWRLGRAVPRLLAQRMLLAMCKSDMESKHFIVRSVQQNVLSGVDFGLANASSTAPLLATGAAGCSECSQRCGLKIRATQAAQPPAHRWGSTAAAAQPQTDELEDSAADVLNHTAGRTCCTLWRLLTGQRKIKLSVPVRLPARLAGPNSVQARRIRKPRWKCTTCSLLQLAAPEQQQHCIRILMLQSTGGSGALLHDVQPPHGRAPPLRCSPRKQALDDVLQGNLNPCL